MELAIHDSMHVSSTACIMINHFNLYHFTLSCLICVKLFCLYIPLSSWNALLLYCPQHRPALGLAPIQCTNIINLNTKEHKGQIGQKGSQSIQGFAGWPWLTHMVPVCSSVNKNLLCDPQYSLRYLPIPRYPSQLSSQSFPLLQNVVNWFVK